MIRIFSVAIMLFASVISLVSRESVNDESFSGHQNPMTFKSIMEVFEERYGISFIYDSSLPTDGVFIGVISENLKLEEALSILFEGTDFKWKVQRKYVVLTLNPLSVKNQDRYRTESDIHGDTLADNTVEQADTLMESRISSMRVPDRNIAQTGLSRLDGKKFKSAFSFMSTPDVIKTIQQLSGVAAGTELMSGLFVHGGIGSDNLYLIDGVPLYQVSHLAGLFSSFNPDIVQSLDFYKSGFPARYGGRLSSVVDVRTQDGDFQNYSGVFSIGLIDGRIQFGGPIVRGRTSFNVSARRSWLDVITTPIMAIKNAMQKDKKNKTGFGYAFGDFNGRITHLFSGDSKLTFNVYYGNDALTLKNKNSLKTNINNIANEYFGTTLLKVNWGNFLTSVNWSKHLLNGMDISMSTFYTRYDSKYFQIDKEWDLETDQYDEYAEKMLSRIQTAGYNADFDWVVSKSNRLRFGVNYQYDFYNPKYRLSDKTEISSQEVYNDEMMTSDRRDAHEASVYVEDEINLGGWFGADIGLRYSLFGVRGKAYHSLEPRAAFNFKFCTAGSFKVSYAEMSQFCHQVRTVNIDIPTYFWAPSAEKIPPMHSRQLAAGVYLDLPHAVTFNVEGFYKWMNHLREYNGRKTLFPSLNNWENFLSEGRGVAYGLEVEAGWKTERLDLAAYYTLSWSKRKFDDFSRDWFFDKNDSRHKFTVNAAYKFSDKIDAYASWNYSTGSRFTIPTHYTVNEGTAGQNMGLNGDYILFSEPNNAKLPDYHRLDIGINFHRKSKKRGLEQVWNLSIYNVYSRLNALTCYVSQEYDESAGKRKYEAKAYGAIPIIPSFSYTVRF